MIKMSNFFAILQIQHSNLLAIFYQSLINKSLISITRTYLFFLAELGRKKYEASWESTSRFPNLAFTPSGTQTSATDQKLQSPTLWLSFVVDI